MLLRLQQLLPELLEWLDRLTAHALLRPGSPCTRSAPSHLCRTILRRCLNMEGDLCHRCRWPCRMDLCHRRHRTPRSDRRHAPAGSGRPARWWRADLRRAFFPSTCRQSWSSRWGVEGVRTFHYHEGGDDQHLEHRRGVHASFSNFAG